MDHTEIANQRVRERAYTLWEEAGCPESHAYEFGTGRHLLSPSRLGDRLPAPDHLDLAGEHSFPASDPVNRM